MENNEQYYDKETLKRLKELTEEVAPGMAETDRATANAVDSALELADANGQKDTLIATIDLQIGLNFFRTDNKTVYATLPSGVHAEVGGQEFQDYILSVAYSMEPRYFISDKGQSDIARWFKFQVTESRKDDYQMHKIFKRVGQDQTDNSVWILSSVAPIKYIHVTPDSITEETNSPLKIVLNQESLPLPPVAPTADFSLINNYLNVEKNQLPLVHNFIIESYCAKKEYQIMQIQGQHHTGKTTLIQILYKLIDPNENDVGQPTDAWSNMIRATSTHLLNYDNMEKANMEKDFASMMSKISTETSYQKRTHHSNRGLTTLKTKNPQIVASIQQVLEQFDVHSRSIVINPPILKASNNTYKNDFWDAFNNDYPTIFNGILKAVQHVLKTKDSVSKENLERMSEAHVIGRALDSFEGLEWGITYDTALADNKELINDSLIDAFPMAQLLKILLDENNNQPIKKSPTAWLHYLAQLKFPSTPGGVSEKSVLAETSPNTTKGVTTAFRNIISPLSKQGIILHQGKDRDNAENKPQRYWKLSKLGVEPVTPVTSVTDTRETLPSVSDASDACDTFEQTVLVEGNYEGSIFEKRK
tara:strand:- start:354 stop:2120 length:1767 start_codon:yes stop_codon:yes gene_type:complete